MVGLNVQVSSTLKDWSPHQAVQAGRAGGDPLPSPTQWTPAGAETGLGAAGQDQPLSPAWGGHSSSGGFGPGPWGAGARWSPCCPLLPVLRGILPRTALRPGRSGAVRAARGGLGAEGHAAAPPCRSAAPWRSLPAGWRAAPSCSPPSSWANSPPAAGATASRARGAPPCPPPRRPACCCCRPPPPARRPPAGSRDPPVPAATGTATGTGGLRCRGRLLGRGGGGCGEGPGGGPGAPLRSPLGPGRASRGSRGEAGTAGVASRWDPVCWPAESRIQLSFVVTRGHAGAPECSGGMWQRWVLFRRLGDLPCADPFILMLSATETAQPQACDKPKHWAEDVHF